MSVLVPQGDGRQKELLPHGVVQVMFFLDAGSASGMTVEGCAVIPQGCLCSHCGEGHDPGHVW